MKEHHYQVQLEWTGNDGSGTQSYRSYRRDHVFQVAGKPPIAGSSDAAFRGDPARHSPEDLLVASLSACHMLWYLHLCAVNAVVVEEYQDAAQGWMTESADGSGQFTRVLLRPRVRIRARCDAKRAHELHEAAHKLCFIARSVSFPVEAEPEIAS